MKKLVPNVKNGGKALPIDDNLYYMSGRKHSSGGIDIGDTLEVEGGEVIQTNSNNLKVFSAQPILNGNSPAKLVLGGANPTEVFKQQEKFKDVNKINDDGTSKLACGGTRKKAKGGIVSVNGNVVNKLLGNISFNPSTGDKKRAALGTKTPIDLLTLLNDNQFKPTTNNKVNKSTKNKQQTKRYVPEKFDITTPNITNPITMPIKGKSYIDDNFKITTDPITNPMAMPNKNYVDKNFKVNTGKITNPMDMSVKGKSYVDKDFNIHTDPITNPMKMPNKNYVDKDFRVNTGKITNPITMPIKGKSYVDKNLKVITPPITNPVAMPNKNYVDKDFNITTPPITNPMDMAMKKGTVPRRNIVTNNTNNTNSGKSNINNNTRRVNSKPTVVNNKVTSKPVVVKSTPVSTTTKTAVPKLDSLDSLLVGLPTSAKQGLPTKLTAPEGIGQPKPSTRSSFLGDLNTYDLIGAGSNLIGSIASGINTNVALNKMQAPEEPTYETAVPMKTNYNIKPQIGEINENVAKTIEDVDANTSSSRVALQRKQRAMNAGQYSRNTLYGQKENIETQLINQDRLNRQQVSARNTALVNDWRNRKNQFNNLIREQKANSINRIFSGVNAGVQDMLTRIEARRNYNNTLGIYDATHPNVDKRLFTDKGVKF